MNKAVLLLILITILSCSKSESEGISQHLLPKKYTHLYNGDFLDSATYEYDNNKLMKISYATQYHNSAGSRDFIYENERLLKVNQFDENNLLIEYIELKYNSDNTLEEYIQYNLVENSAIKHILTYNFNSNISVISFTGDFTSQENLQDETTYTLDILKNITKIKGEHYLTIFTYDKKNNPFKNIFAKDILNLIGILHYGLDRGVVNNCLSYNVTYDNRVTTHVDLIYLYNENSYPKKITYKDPDMSATVEFNYL